MIPYKNRDTLSIFGYYGTMVPLYPDPIFSGEGQVWQMSGRYSKLLSVQSGKKTRREKRASLGFDFKDTNSNLDFGGIPVTASAAQIAQIVFGYNESYVVSEKGYIGVDATLTWSPGGFSKYNSDEAFAGLREDAYSDYLYASVNVMAVRYLNKKWQWNIRGNGQWSGGRLLPIEQLGLGGDGSVRGYNTYAANGDSGWVFSNELATRFKPLGLNTLLQKLPPYCSVRKIKDEYQVFGFADAGGGWNYDAKFYEKKYIPLYGMGLGTRYNFGPWIRLEAAYGWQLKDLEYNDYKDRAHVSVVISR
jgi:hemolysin activation/secretion protein